METCHRWRSFRGYSCTLVRLKTRYRHDSIFYLYGFIIVFIFRHHAPVHLAVHIQRGLGGPRRRLEQRPGCGYQQEQWRTLAAHCHNKDRRIYVLSKCALGMLSMPSGRTLSISLTHILFHGAAYDRIKVGSKLVWKYTDTYTRTHA